MIAGAERTLADPALQAIVLELNGESVWTLVEPVFTTMQSRLDGVPTPLDVPMYAEPAEPQSFVTSASSSPSFSISRCTPAQTMRHLRSFGFW